MRRVNHSKRSLADELARTRLAIEKAKLAKLEADLPKPAPQYTRYEDLPPPSPEEQDRFYERLETTIGRMEVMSLEELREWEDSEFTVLPDDVDEREKPTARFTRDLAQ